MKYEILTAVSYRHTFLPGHGYEGISVSIPAPTTTFLQQNGLLLKPLRDGFLLLYDTMPAGNSRTREALLRENISLVFNLALKDPLFYNYTQVRMEAVTNSLFFFSNAQPAATGALHQEAFVTAQDLRSLETLGERWLVKPFGRVELQINEHLQLSYYISFQAKATRWCYFLMSEGLRALSHPAVIDTNGNDYFDTPVKARLPGNEEVPVFISKNPLQLVNGTSPTFQLVDYSTTDPDRYKVVIAALPGPEISRISNAGAALYENENDYSEIFLY